MFLDADLLGQRDHAFDYIAEYREVYLVSDTESQVRR